MSYRGRVVLRPHSRRCAKPCTREASNPPTRRPRIGRRGIVYFLTKGGREPILPRATTGTPKIGPQRRHPMAVCIARLAEKSRAMLVVADNATTPGSNRDDRMQETLAFRSDRLDGSDTWHRWPATSPI